MDTEQEEFYFQWHIINACNLRCKHCYQTEFTDNELVSFSKLKFIVERIRTALKKWGRKGRIAITGGEPLIHKDFFSLLSYLENLPEIGKISVLTNGTLITKKEVALFKSYKKLHFIQISLDGANSKTHDIIRGKGNYEKALSAVKLLVKDQIPVRIMYTFQKNNVVEIPALIDLAISEGIDDITFERLVPSGRSAKKKNDMISPQKMKEVFQYISDRSIKEKKKGTALTIMKLRTLWALLDKKKYKNKTKPIDFKLILGAICSIGIDSLTILPDGTVLPCRRLPIPIGNLFNDSIFKIWYTSPLLWEIRNKQNLKGKCQNCELIPNCSGCRAIAYAVTGDYLAEDPQCWK